MQHGHANFPFVLQPDRLAYVGKSLIVHINDAFIWKFWLFGTSFVSIPLSCNIFNSSIKGLKYALITFLGPFVWE